MDIAEKHYSNRKKNRLLLAPWKIYYVGYVIINCCVVHLSILLTNERSKIKTVIQINKIVNEIYIFEIEPK